MDRPSAIIFDMDGVLVDSEPIHVEATRRLLSTFGVSYDVDAGDDFFGFSDREVFRVLRARHALEPDEETLGSLWVAEVLPLIARGVVPAPGVPAIVFWLRNQGFRLALGSGSAPPIIEATLRSLGVQECFEHVVSASDVGRGKPAPDIFLEALRRLGVPADRALVIEDSRNGLVSAVSAGIPCVVVPCPSTCRQDFREATLRLSSLTELPAWLDGLPSVRPNFREAAVCRQ
ncbi:MAG: HAD family hydrolase [Vicinamibacterales bacterium]